MSETIGLSTAKGFIPVENKALKVGDIVIPRKKLLWSGEQKITTDGHTFSFDESLIGKTLELEYSTLSSLSASEVDGQYTVAHKFVKFKMHHLHRLGFVEFMEGLAFNYDTEAQVVGSDRLRVYFPNGDIADGSEKSIHIEVDSSNSSAVFGYIYSIYEVIE